MKKQLLLSTLLLVTMNICPSLINNKDDAKQLESLDHVGELQENFHMRHGNLLPVFIIFPVEYNEFCQPKGTPCILYEENTDDSGNIYYTLIHKTAYPYCGGKVPHEALLAFPYVYGSKIPPGCVVAPIAFPKTIDHDINMRFLKILKKGTECEVPHLAKKFAAGTLVSDVFYQMCDIVEGWRQQYFSDADVMMYNEEGKLIKGSQDLDTTKHDLSIILEPIQ